VLSGVSASEPGPWRTERTPYLKAIMDALSPHDPCGEVTFQKGTQVGATEAGNNWAGYIMANSGGPVMVVYPTSNTAKRASKTRIAPMIEHCPVLAQRVAKPRARNESNTALMKEFEGGVLVLAGANSGPELRSAPVKYLYLDELDAYPYDVDGEGDPEVIAIKRTDTFARRKVFRTSSPKLAGTSRIARAYERSDQCRYQVPCPHCAERQPLVWEQLRWALRTVAELICTHCGVIAEEQPAEKGAVAADGRAHIFRTHCESCGAAFGDQEIKHRETDDVAAAWYECAGCGGVIPEHHKSTMLSQGSWVPAHPERSSEHRGFHLNALYSPLGWFSWRAAVMQYLAAENAKDPKLVQVLHNTVLGEPYRPESEAPDLEALRARVETDWRLGEIPAGALLLTAGVDVQGDRLELVVKGYGEGEESWLIEWQSLHGDPAQMGEGSVWAELDKLLEKVWTHPGGGLLKVAALAIDSGGHHTQEVYEYCRHRRGRHVIAVKGSSRAGKPILGRPTEQDVNFRGKLLKGGVKLWPVGPDTAKAQVYARLKHAPPGPRTMHFPAGLPDEYFTQLTAERQELTYRHGYPRYEWRKHPGARNEALDCECYAYAAALYAGVQRANWARLAAAMNPLQKSLFPVAPPGGAAVDKPTVPTQPVQPMMPNVTPSIAARPNGRRVRSSLGVR